MQASIPACSSRSLTRLASMTSPNVPTTTSASVGSVNCGSTFSGVRAVNSVPHSLHAIESHAVSGGCIQELRGDVVGRDGRTDGLPGGAAQVQPARDLIALPTDASPRDGCSLRRFLDTFDLQYRGRVGRVGASN